MASEDIQQIPPETHPEKNSDSVWAFVMIMVAVLIVLGVGITLLVNSTNIKDNLEYNRQINIDAINACRAKDGVLIFDVHGKRLVRCD